MRIPAIKSTQSGRVVYQITASFEVLEKILSNSVNDGSDILHQFQRPIDRKKAEDFFEYLYWRIRHKQAFTIPNLVGCFISEDNYLLSYEDGFLSFPEIYRFSCVDGQHRMSGIANLLENCPKETHHQVGITLIECADLKARQQVFADINSNAKPASKAQSLEFDHSSDEVKLSKAVRDSVPLFSLLCEKNLSKNQPTQKAIISLYVLHKLIQENIEDLIVLVGVPNHDYSVYYSAYWEAVSETLSYWSFLNNAVKGGLSDAVYKKVWEVKRTTFAFSSTALATLNKLFVHLMGKALPHKSKWLNASDRRQWLKVYFAEKIAELSKVDFYLDPDNGYLEQDILRIAYRKDGTECAVLNTPRRQTITKLLGDFINRID